MDKLVAFLVSNDWMSWEDHGEYNGYVAVPGTHKWAELSYDDVPVQVHGGLTFRGILPASVEKVFLTENTNIPEDWVVFGFDTNHFSDNLDNWNKTNCEKETLNLLNQFYEAYN